MVLKIVVTSVPLIIHCHFASHDSIGMQLNFAIIAQRSTVSYLLWVLRMHRRFKMASTCKGVPVPPMYESRYSVMDEDFSSSLHILNQSERELCENELYLDLLHRVSLAGRRMMKEERKKKKNLKKIGQIGIFHRLWSDSLARV